jgi:ribosome-associated protein
MALVAAAAAESLKATDILALDVSHRLPLADVFVLASGSNERQVTAIVEQVEEALGREGVNAVRREGRPGARWVLLDFGLVVVHVFHAEDREFYGLDRLWKDCPQVELGLQDLVRATAVGE